MWVVNKPDNEQFIKQANSHHTTIKFTAEISDIEATFLDTIVFKGKRFTEQSTLDIKTLYRPTETFQYTYFFSCRLPGVKTGFVKGEALRILRTHSSHFDRENSI